MSPNLATEAKALQMRKVLQVLALALVGNNPRISRHVRNGILAGDERAIGEALVKYAIQAICLAHISVDRVWDLCRRILAEMMILTGHRTEAAHLPKQPLGDLDFAAKIGAHEFSGPLGKIKKDRAACRRPLARDQQSPGYDC